MKKLFFALVLVTFAIASPARAWQASNNGLEIYVFRVGQADSMLIVGPRPARRTLLVDMGVSQRGAHTGTVTADHVANRIFEITGRRHVDYFLLTHFHEDHLGTERTGMARMIDRPDGITIGTVIDTASIGVPYVWPPHVRNRDPRPGYESRIAAWDRIGAIQRRVLPLLGTSQIDLGRGVSVDILAFGGQFAADEPSVHVAYEQAHRGYYRSHRASENDLSIAFELSLGNFEFWSGGDLSGADGDGTAALSGSSGSDYTNVEYPMVRSWAARNRESDVEVYRASHHGARYSSGVPFLAALDPEHIIYSADVGHRHPTADVVGRVLPHVRQYATGLDSHWRNRRLPADQRFENQRGQVVREVRIFVSPDGSRYTINGAPFRSFSDAEERRDLDRR